MIQSLTIKNFLSFKDEVIISFEASKDDHLEEYHVVEVAPGVRLLKFLVLYGYNASGKSNLIQAIYFLRDFIFRVKEQKTHLVDVIPFSLDIENLRKPSKFALTFYIGKTKYIYRVTLNTQEVLHEKLDFYPSIRPANVFERFNQDGVSKISFGSTMSVSKLVREEIALKCLPNMSVFAAYSQVNAQVNKLSDVSTYFINSYFQPIEPTTILKDFVQKLIISNTKSKVQIKNYLKRADFNVSDITTKEIDKDEWDEIVNKMRASGASDKEIRMYEKQMSQTMQTEFTHTVLIDGKEKKVALPLSLQSGGTIRIFGLSGAINQAIDNDAFLAIDEIESKLHPQLVEFLIEEFLRESKQAQLLVTTHYDNLFDQEDLLRKDNFWFVEKGEDASSKLYPLYKFSGLNRISSLQKAYRFGKFGAVPDID